jgi:dTDP-4-amino-4,6-dideoxygalactose transaminase
VKRYRIPFNRPALVGEEFRYVCEAIEGGHLSGDGPFTRRCCQLLESWLRVERAMLTTSCTHALEICALLLDIQPDDEVIVASFAFVTTVGAFALRGARPVFADIRPDTLNLDEGALREKITPRTKAIVVLHYGGVACEMNEIEKVSRETGVPVVEDNAHGLFGKYRDRELGTFGCLATQSFHETKNFTCGEGGALLINRSDWIERAEIIREKGTDRSRFFRGQVDKYTWVGLGSSYLPSELLAAFLSGQLEARERVQTRRVEIWRRYREELSGWAAKRGVGLPQIPPHCAHPSHLFYLILPSIASRTRLIDHLARRGILAVFHYLPLHLSEMGRRFGGRPGQCPVTEQVSDRLLRLPLYWGLTEEEQSEVIERIREFDPR